ncbi:hypothetical protein AVEN_73771-1, partial [Araneus ventricosus]
SNTVRGRKNAIPWAPFEQAKLERRVAAVDSTARQFAFGMNAGTICYSFGVYIPKPTIMQ